MVGIISISDLHNHHHCQARLDYIREQYPDDYLLVTGDLTQNGDEWEYRAIQSQLRYWIDRGRLLAAPGNHDARNAGILWWRREGIKTFDATFRTSFFGLNKPAVTEFVRDRFVVIRLDSNCENWNWALACGRVGFYQRYCLSNMLEMYGVLGWTRLVALHHHPFDRGFGRALLDSKEFMTVLKGRCEILCFGHKHIQERCTQAQEEHHIPRVLAAGALFEQKTAWRITVGPTICGCSAVPIL